MCHYLIAHSTANFIQHIAAANQHLGHKSYWNKGSGFKQIHFFPSLLISRLFQLAAVRFFSSMQVNEQRFNFLSFDGVFTLSSIVSYNFSKHWKLQGSNVLAFQTKTQFQTQVHPNHWRQNIIGSTKAKEMKIQHTLLKTQSTMTYKKTLCMMHDISRCLFMLLINNF